MFGLDYLISPCSRDDFFGEHFGVRAFRIEGGAEKFARLVDWQGINDLVNYGGTANRTDRLVANHDKLSASEFYRLGHWINEGATYVINYLQNRDPVFDQFARILGAELNRRVSINCYVSAKSMQGFDTHFDTHDVFIVHLYGSKQWSVFDPDPVHPLDGMTSSAKKPEGKPYLECRLEPGDVLYIPRGHWHHAVADETCAHLTVGVGATTPVDFMRWFVERGLLPDEFFRQDFPVADAALFLGDRKEAELEEFVEQFRERLLQQLSGDSFVHHFTRFVMEGNRVQPIQPVVLPDQFLLEDNITLDTEFEVPLGQKIILQEDPRKNIGVVIARGAVVEFGGVPGEVLSAIFHRDPDRIRGRQLREEFPGMEEAQIRSLLVALTAHGIIQLKPQGENTPADPRAARSA